MRSGHEVEGSYLSALCRRFQRRGKSKPRNFSLHPPVPSLGSNARYPTLPPNRFIVSLYLVFCAIAGVVVANGALHPTRRLLTSEEEASMRQVARQLDSNLTDVSITTPDAVALHAWIIRPNRTNNDAVILLHGLSDNRVGTTGYAQLLLANGFAVLLPDARAHGASGGQLATYGLLERNDIHQWFDFVAARDHPHCIFGLGESMGAAELLQSLAVEPRFCAVAAESSFSSFREIAFGRMGQPFHLGPWLGDTILRPVVEFAFLYVRWKIPPRYATSLARRFSRVHESSSSSHPWPDSTATFLCAIPSASTPAIPTLFSGKFPTPITAAPSAPLRNNTSNACSRGSSRAPQPPTQELETRN